MTGGDGNNDAAVTAAAMSPVAFRHATATVPQKQKKSSNSETETATMPVAKRQHKGSASGEPDSAARRWMKAELEYYESMKSSNDKLNYYPWIPKNTKKPQDPPIAHLVDAAKEFARRFIPFRSTEEEEVMNDELSSESPFLLVATKVRDNWKVPVNFKDDHFVRFRLMPGESKNDSILFIKCMAGPKHGMFQAYITVDINDWIRDNGLRDVVCRMVNGGTRYQPDEAYIPKYPDRLAPDLDASAELDGDPYARLVIEVEYAHRGANALREDGFAALDNPYTRLFLAVKIWPKGKMGTFAAAAVLWGKDDNGVVFVRQAIDFGTKAMERVSKNKFQEQGHDSMLPPVGEWTRPHPTQPHANLRAELDAYEASNNIPNNGDWAINLPATDILYKQSTRVSTNDMPYYFDMKDAIPGCVINIQVFMWHIKDKKF